MGRFGALHGLSLEWRSGALRRSAPAWSRPWIWITWRRGPLRLVPDPWEPRPDRHPGCQQTDSVGCKRWSLVGARCQYPCCTSSGAASPAASVSRAPGASHDFRKVWCTGGHFLFICATESRIQDASQPPLPITDLFSE